MGLDGFKKSEGGSPRIKIETPGMDRAREYAKTHDVSLKDVDLTMMERTRNEELDASLKTQTEALLTRLKTETGAQIGVDLNQYFNPQNAVSRLVKEAQKAGQSTVGSFNNITIVAEPDSNVDALYAAYREAFATPGAVARDHKAE